MSLVDMGFPGKWGAFREKIVSPDTWLDDEQYCEVLRDENEWHLFTDEWILRLRPNLQNIDDIDSELDWRVVDEHS